MTRDGSGRHLRFYCGDFAVESLPAFERFACGLLDERLVVGQSGQPVGDVGRGVVEGRGSEQTSFVEADAGEEFSDQFLLSVLLAEHIGVVLVAFHQAVTDFVEERGIVLLDALERFRARHPDALLARVEVSRVAAEGDGSLVESCEFLSGLDRREGDDLVRSLEVREVALVHGEHGVVASEQELVGLAVDHRLLLVFDCGEVGDGQATSASLDLTAESLHLIEGEVVVVRAVEGEGERIDAAVGLAAHAVLRRDRDPRLLPRCDSVLEAGDEAVSDDIGDRDFGGLAHLVWFGRCPQGTLTP